MPGVPSIARRSPTLPGACSAHAAVRKLPIRRCRERAQRRDRCGRDIRRAASEKLQPLSMGYSAEATLRRNRRGFPKFQPQLARLEFRARGWQAFQWRGARRSSSVRSKECLLRAPSRSYYAEHWQASNPREQAIGRGRKASLRAFLSSRRRWTLAQFIFLRTSLEASSHVLSDALIR